ncbi:MAG: hypothetical protein LIP03_09400 [Bacteroidales bacterium]|nr:hypothetical protein [Bacteroidales bacterium]
MIYQIDEIAHDVRVALGLNGWAPKPVFADSQQLRIEEQVRLFAPEAAATVLAEAPIEKLGPGLPFADSIAWAKDDLWGWTLVPADFLRLIAFQMDDWAIPVTEPILSHDPQYLKQKSPISGVRGTPYRPVCAIVPRAEGLALEFYSCLSQDAQPIRALYTPRPAWDPNLSIEMPQHLYPQIISCCASLCAQAQ